MKYVLPRIMQVGRSASAKSLAEEKSPNEVRVHFYRNIEIPMERELVGIAI